MRIPSFVVLGAVLLVSSGTAIGHEGATGIVKERMDDMKRIGRASKRIDDRLRAKRRPEEISADAEVIRVAAVRMPSLFPAGSRDGHSEAKAAVWERWPDFVAAARLMGEEAEKLAVAARSGDQAAIAVQVKAVARSCTGCHDAFRAKR